tara:strand:- start:454 stop:711 length:258 start_codon:yes stop_codon:yes gene_type:complete
MENRNRIIELLTTVRYTTNDIEKVADEICSLFNVVESSELEANDEQGAPIVDEDGSMTCNCVEPKQSSFPNGKWICIKCWGEWYH